MDAFTASQICHFDVIILEEYIFWLDVSMKYAILMHMIDSLQYLVHVVLHFLGVQVVLSVTID